MQVSEIASGSFETVDAEADVETVRTALLAAETDAVFVTGTPRPGLVTRRPPAPDVTAATASALATPLPTLPAEADLRDAARTLVANRVPVVPVGSGRALTGRVSATAVLERVPAEAEPMTVAEARTRSAATPPAELAVEGVAGDRAATGPDRRSGIAFGGELVGTPSADPAASGGRGSGAGTAREAGDGGRAFRPGTDAGTPGAGPDTPDAVAPVDEAVRPGEPVAAAVGTMLRGDHDGVPVSPDGERVTGVLTRADVLDALAGPDRTTMDLDLVNGHHLRATTREEVAARLAAVVGGDRMADGPRGTVRLARSVAGGEPRPPMRCTVSVRAGDARRSVTADAEDADLALAFAMERLERTLERD